MALSIVAIVGASTLVIQDAFAEGTALKFSFRAVCRDKVGVSALLLRL